MTPRQFVWEPITLWDGGSGDWRLQVVSSDVDDTVDAAVATRRHEANGCFWQDVTQRCVIACGAVEIAKVLPALVAQGPSLSTASHWRR